MIDITRAGKFSEVLIIKNKVFIDHRGQFAEVFNDKTCEFLPRFVQDNASISRQGTFRGLHYQLKPRAQGKLVYCPFGKIYDFVVDIRKNSPTFGLYEQIELDNEQNFATTIYVPEGFAHGFFVLSDYACVAYKVSDYYSPAHERSLNYAEFNFSLPGGIKYIAEKDRQAPPLGLIETNF